MAVPYTFGSATAAIPLSQLDSNFATTITLGNTAIQLGNTVTTLNNMSLANVTVSSGNVTVTTLTAPTINSGSGVALSLQSNATTAITVDTSQNVGIGTTSPSYKLDVNKGSNGVSARFGNGTNYYYTYSDGSGNYLAADTSINTALFMSPTSSGVMTFLTANTERARFDSSGNFLVGGTTYTGVGVSIAKPDSSGCFSIFAAGGTGYHWRFGNVSNGIVGSITTTSSATGFNPSSDRRLKENIQPMTDGLSRVLKLKPVTYNWITDGSEDDGFIAQDLQSIPEFSRRVNPIGEKDGETYYGVDYMRFVSVLTAAIQEQQALITTLTERITALENK
jgi:hypothetical protein